MLPPHVISVSFVAKSDSDQAKLESALHELAKNDPTFAVSPDRPRTTTVIRGMGEIHLQIILDRIQREFGVEPKHVSKPEILYRSSPKSSEGSADRLLEPIMALEVCVPEQFVPTVVADLNRRRGSIQAVENRGDKRIVMATAPLSEMLGYATDLRMQTDFTATYSMCFDRYDQIP